MSTWVWIYFKIYHLHVYNLAVRLRILHVGNSEYCDANGCFFFLSLCSSYRCNAINIIRSEKSREKRSHKDAAGTAPTRISKTKRLNVLSLILVLFVALGGKTVLKLYNNILT